MPYISRVPFEPYLERMIKAVHDAGGEVVEIGIEFGAPEVRFSFPDGTPHQKRMDLRKTIIKIQQEIPWERDS